MLSPAQSITDRLRSSAEEPVYYIQITKSEGLVGPGATLSFWRYSTGGGLGSTTRTFTSGPVAWTDRTALVDDYNLHENRLNRSSIRDLVSKLNGTDKLGGIESIASTRFSLDNTDGALAGKNPIDAFSGDPTNFQYAPEFSGRKIEIFLTFSDITDRSDSLRLFTGRVGDVREKGDRIELDIESRFGLYDGTVPPNVFENDQEEFPRLIDGEPVPLVFGSHDAAPGFLTAPIAFKSSVDVGPIVKFADMSIGMTISSISKMMYAEDGFIESGPADIASGAPNGLSTYTPYSIDSTNAEIGFTQEEIEYIYCFLVVRPRGKASEVEGAWALAVNPENAIDGDLTTYATASKGGVSGAEILQLRLPTMNSGAEIARDETSGLSGVFVTLKADLLLGSDPNSTGYFYFSKEKSSLLFADGLKIDDLKYADNGSYNNLGGAGQAKWQLKAGTGGGFSWANFGTLSALANKYLVVEQLNGLGVGIRVYDIKLMIYFKVKLPTEGYLAAVDGYQDSGAGTITGTGNLLFENPGHILSAMAVYFSGGDGASDVDIIHNRDVLAPKRSSWKFSRSIVEQRDFLDYVERLSREGLFWTVADDQGRLKGVPWEAGTAPADIEISPADLVDGNLESFVRTPAREIISDYRFKYKYNHIRDDFDGLLYCNKDGSSAEFGAIYESICDWAEFDNGGKGKAEEFEFEWIRDRATMVEAAKMIFDFYSVRRWSISFTGDLALVTTQVGDRLDLSSAGDWPENYPPDMLAAKYRVSEVRIRSNRDLVTIKASEVF